MWKTLRAARHHRLRRTRRWLRAPAGSLGRLRPAAVLARLAAALLGVAGLILLLAAAYSLWSAITLFPAARAASRVRLDIPGPPYTSPRFVDRTGSRLLSSVADAAHTPYWLSISSSGEGHAVPPLALAAAQLALGIDTTSRPAGVGAGLTAIAHSLKGTMDAAGLAAEGLAERPDLAATFATRPMARAILAGELASRYSTQELLEWSLNTQPYGHLTRGLDAAALEDYGVHAERLGLAEWATLAALSSQPELGGNVHALAAARNILVRQLRERGLVDAASAATAVAATPVIQPAVSALSPVTSDFLALARSQLEEQETRLAASATPLVVTTSLDSEMQLQALCAAQTVLARAQSGTAVTAMPTLDGRECAAAEFLDTAQPAGEADLAVAVWDVERSELLAYFTSARGKSGSEAYGQAGTAVLPFVYLTAFAKGYTPGTMVLDVPQAVGQAQGTRVTPTNLDGRYLGPMLASQALREERIVPAVSAMADVGGDNLRQTLTGVGLGALADTAGGLPGLFSQQGELSLLELTRAYAIFAAGGLDRAASANGLPILILAARDPGGNSVMPAAQVEPRLVLSRGLAYLIQDGLRREVLASNGSRAPSGALAAGSSLSGIHHWAFAFDSRLVVGVLATSTGPSDGSLDNIAEPVARAVLAWSAGSYASAQLAQPPEVSRVRVCSPSGMLPTPACQQVVSEVFLSGTEPTSDDTYYQSVAINRETGRRATLWTPTALVENVGFVNPPPAAREWALANGLVLAPQEYDTLPLAFEATPDLIIRAPAPFAIVRGPVEVHGTAATPEMVHFRLEAGEGLYPQRWLLLAEGDKPLTGALLATWDTAALDGTVSLQVSTTDAQGNLRRMAVPLTVDNQAPEVHFATPAAQGRVDLPRAAPLAAVVEASDNYGVQRVELILDGHVVIVFERAPYSMRWSGLPAGRHTLQARAYDAAGNSALTPMLEIEIN
ncbi:MAG: transglycosylase domain-containing protein [Chloroflexi bacterium]|nr:transglycosylase domain-containing protein [Chloroflexota bacterium]